MKLYEYNPQIESNFKEQSRIVGEITGAVSRCIQENNFGLVAHDLSHRVCEYHFADPERRKVSIRTELVKDPLYASVDLNGAETDVEAIKDLIRRRDIPNVQLED